MLLLIQEVIGGTVRIERISQYGYLNSHKKRLNTNCKTQIKPIINLTKNVKES